MLGYLVQGWSYYNNSFKAKVLWFESAGWTDDKTITYKQFDKCGWRLPLIIAFVGVLFVSKITLKPLDGLPSNLVEGCGTG